MPPNHEQRSIQKRTLALLIKAKNNPQDINQMIKEFCIEMEQEDVALVKQELGEN